MLLPIILCLALAAVIAGIEVGRQFKAGNYGLLAFKDNSTVLYPFYVLGWIFTFPLHRAAREANPPPLDVEKYYAQVELVREYVAARTPGRIDPAIAVGSAAFWELTDKKREADELGIDPYVHMKRRYGTDDPIKFMGDLYLKALATFDEKLPPVARGEGVFTAHASEVLPNSSAIDAFFHVFKRDANSPPNDKCFYRQYLDYQERWYACRKKVEERKYEQDSPAYYKELLELNTNETLFWNVPVSIPNAQRFEGTWIVAPTNTGKTTLLSALIYPDLDAVAAGKASIIVFDSKGSFSNAVARLARFGPGGDLEGKLVYIEPHDRLAINPLDLAASTGHTIELIEYLFSFGMKTTSMQAMLFRSLLMAVQATDKPTFSTFRRLMNEGVKNFMGAIMKLHPEDQDYFLKPSVGGKSEYDSSENDGTKRQLLWRMRDLTTAVPLLRDMFRADKTRVKLGELMDQGRVIVINNSVKLLGESGSEFLGRLFLAMIKGEADQRAHRKPHEKLPTYVYIDEADTCIGRDDNVNKILTKCREQKIALILAHQKLADIPSDLVKAALRDCGLRFANVDDEAPELSGRFRTTPEILRNLRQGQFAMFVRRHPKSIVVNVPNRPIQDEPQMTEERFEAMRDKMRVRFSFTPPATDDPEPVLPPRTYTTEASDRG